MSSLGMNQSFKTATTNQLGTIVRLLGSGTQGEVYEAALNGGKVAVKWYHAQFSSAYQRATIESLTRKDPPGPSFVWPLEMIHVDGHASFGYVMPLVEGQFCHLTDLLEQRVDTTLKTLATTGYNLADAYHGLHSQGLCYRDISFGNIFFDPGTGAIKICDNDNVAIDGDRDCSVYGTSGFIAPEIVRGESLPNIQTDLHSLATLLFYVLLQSHPFEGALETKVSVLDEEARTRLYGTDVCFIFDPSDDSNRPDPDRHKNALIYWALYPRFLRKVFTQAFTRGIRDTETGRVRENEWRHAMVHLRDSIFGCPSCGRENIYCRERVKKHGSLSRCWSCGNKPGIPPRIRTTSSTVTLERGVCVYAHHFGKPFNFGSPIAEVEETCARKKSIKLRNRSQITWQVKAGGTRWQQVQPGESLRLSADAEIRLGNKVAEVSL